MSERLIPVLICLLIFGVVTSVVMSLVTLSAEPLVARIEALEREHALHHPECPDIVDEHPLKPAKR